MITRNMNITKGRLSLERQICRTGSIDNSTKYKASAPWRLRWHRVHLNQGDLAAPMAQSPPATRETWRLRWHRVRLRPGRPGAPMAQSPPVTRETWGSDGTESACDPGDLAAPMAKNPPAIRETWV